MSDLDTGFKDLFDVESQDVAFKSFIKTSKGLVSTISDLGKALEGIDLDNIDFKDVKEDAKKLREKLDALAVSGENVYASILKMGVAQIEAGRNSSRAVSAMKKQADEQLRLAISSKKSDAEIQSLAKTVYALQHGMSRTAIEVKKYNDAMKKAEASTQGHGASLQLVADNLKSFGNSLAGTSRSLMGFVSTMAGATVSFGASRKMLIDYNKGMMSLIRTARVSGRSLADFDQALKNVTATTSMSRSEFVKFAADFQRSFAGMGFATTQLAEFASGLRNAFGDDIDAQTQAANSLRSVMSQFPALGRQIMEANKLAAEAAAEGSDETRSALEAELNTRRGIISAALQAQGATQEQMNDVMNLTQMATAEQSKYNESLAAQQELQKTTEELLLEMGQTFEKITNTALEFSQHFLEAFGGATPWIIGTTIALGGIGKSLTMVSGLVTSYRAATLNLTAAKMGLLKVSMILGGVLGGAVVVGAVVAAAKAFNGLRSSIAEASAETEGMTQSTRDMAREQRARYREASNAIQPLENNIMNTANRMEILRINTEQYTKANLDLSRSLGETVNILSEMFGLTDDNVASMFGGIEVALENARSSFRNFARELMFDEGRMDVLESLFADSSIGMPVLDSENLEGSMDKLFDSLNERLEDLSKSRIELETAGGDSLDLEAISTQMATIQGNMAQINQARNSMLDAENQAIQAQVNQASARNRQELRMNEVLRNRLQLEADIVSAAQFGMGASVQIMQERVRAENEALKLNEGIVRGIEERIDKRILEGKETRQLNEEERASLAEIVNLSRDGAEVRERLNYLQDESKITAEDANRLERNLLSLIHEREQSVLNMMQHQKTIYELTKEVREGYLDAVREMTVGNTVFQNIVATQERGVTQILDAVHSVHGDFRANTMRAGGYQTPEQTAAGMGAGQPMRYGLGGLMGTDSMQLFTGRYPFGQDLTDRQQEVMAMNRGITAKAGPAFAMGAMDEEAAREEMSRSAEDASEKIDELANSTDRFRGALDSWSQGLLFGANPIFPGAEGQHGRSIMFPLLTGDNMFERHNTVQRKRGSLRPEMVGGTGSGDIIPALLEPGEFVMNREATSKYAHILSAMNRGSISGFQEGGPVSRQSVASEIIRDRVQLNLDPSRFKIDEELGTQAVNLLNEMVEGVNKGDLSLSQVLRKLTEHMEGVDRGIQSAYVMSKIEDYNLFGEFEGFTDEFINAYQNALNNILGDFDRLDLSAMRGDLERDLNDFAIQARAIMGYGDDSDLMEALQSVTNEILEFHNSRAIMPILTSRQFLDSIAKSRDPNEIYDMAEHRGILLSIHKRMQEQSEISNEMQEAVEEAVEEPLGRPVMLSLGDLPKIDDLIESSKIASEFGAAINLMTGMATKSMETGTIDSQFVNDIQSMFVDQFTKEEMLTIGGEGMVERLSSDIQRGLGILRGEIDAEAGDYDPEFLNDYLLSQVDKFNLAKKELSSAQERLSQMARDEEGRFTQEQIFDQNRLVAELQEEKDKINENMQKALSVGHISGEDAGAVNAAMKFRDVVGSALERGQARSQLSTQDQINKRVQGLIHGEGFDEGEAQKINSLISEGVPVEVAMNRVRVGQPDGQAQLSRRLTSATGGRSAITQRTVTGMGGGQVAAIGTGWRNASNQAFSETRSLGGIISGGGAGGGTSGQMMPPNFNPFDGGGDQNVGVDIGLTPEARRLFTTNITTGERRRSNQGSETENQNRTNNPGSPVGRR